MGTAVLARLVEERHGLLVELRRLADRQAELIEQGDLGRLFGLLAVKQRMLNELVQVDRRLDPFREEEPERRVWRSPAEQQRCRAQAEACEQLLREIIALERSGESQLIRRRDRATELAQGLHHAAVANQAYQAPEVISGGQLDVSCDA